MPPALPKRNISTAEKHFQQEQQQEKELNKLCQDFFVLEQERTRHLATGYPKLKKTTKIVKIFENEYENILIDLAVATSPGNVRKENKEADRLQTLIETYDKKTKLVRRCKTQMKELEDNISKTAKSVQTLKKQQITDHQYEVYFHKARQTLDRVENQLETQMKKFNMIVVQNASLRNEIDHFLWDRRNFLSVWQDFLTKLNTGKQIMLDLIQQASIAYDQREEWWNRLQLLRITGHKDFLSNIDKMRAYNTRMDQGLKLRKFLSHKDQKRVMRDLYRKERIKRTEIERALEEKLEHYKKIMEDIKQFTKEDRIQVLARDYYNNEAANFTNFTYVIELIKEMEQCNDQLTFLDCKIEHQKLLQSDRAATQTNVLKHLEELLEKENQETQKDEQELEEIDSHLNEIMQGVWKLFNICRCSQDPVIKLLGENSTIKHYNALLYCQVLEKTVHDNLVKAAFKVKNPEKRTTSIGRIFNHDKVNLQIYSIDNIVTDTPCSLCVEHEIASDVIDIVERPLSKTGAYERLKQRLELPNGAAVVHRLSKCHLPAARQIIQKAYQ